MIKAVQACGSQCAYFTMVISIINARRYPIISFLIKKFQYGKNNKIIHNFLEQPFIPCFLLFGVTAFASKPSASTSSATRFGFAAPTIRARLILKTKNHKNSLEKNTFTLIVKISIFNLRKFAFSVF